MKVFRNINGEKVNVVKHTLDVLAKHPNAEIHIGTDSQNKKRHTIYATVIAYRYGNRGVHYIYSKKRVDKIKDLWTRLWNEAQYSVEVAEWMTEQINVRVDIEIDMDYNPDKRFDSNKLLAAARGYANGLGYRVNVKPFGQTATFENYACKAADHHCRT